ncbi:MAG: D-alanyl-D-alanine carboxypeptidase/D-alanyl-D-alanine-endopeptidase [Cellulomonas sp.]|jgi:D-alanyl-D-alanine carboxypeptidase/D-alanyl-D-alanine-endopeptidase (penicillin-binding protein 4)|nr:D-alanyl-D-alanine carboxypeptidase/D-alanyl-D-alanine-endopeptidase [Cellulomonas sp.]
MVRTAAWVTATVVGALVLGAGGYGAADAYDLVPGVLTLEPAPSPAPFPTVVVPEPDGPALEALDPGAPVPAAGQVQSRIEALVADPRLGPSVGVAVADQLTGEVLGQRSAGTGRQPASIAKVLTAVAALSVLGPDTTLPTTAVLAGDQVVLVGGGDIMLGDGAGGPDVVDGRAGLGDLAEQTAGALRADGVSTVRLGVDDSLFTGPATAPGWDPSYQRDGYVAPVTALAVHVGKTDPTKEYSQRHADPSLAAGQVFAARLAEQGITVTGPVTRTTAPQSAAPVGAVASAPVRDVTEYFLRTSDNTVTETVARLVAIDQGRPASFEGATAAVLDVVARLGVDTTGARLADASGLAAGSAVPATTFLGAVRLAASSQHPVLRDIVVGMPIGGLTGTLAARYTTSDVRGLVRAKTGSLPGVTSLAGTVVTADGRALNFVVMADQTPGNQAAARAAVDDFVSDLGACGCR